MIQVSHLSFSYTRQPFISDMSFSVSSGEIFGFLGPSGAGKSTLQKVLTGMLVTYQGSAVVNGVECRERTKSFYEDIGVDFEFSTIKDGGVSVRHTFGKKRLSGRKVFPAFCSRLSCNCGPAACFQADLPLLGCHSIAGSRRGAAGPDGLIADCNPLLQ